MDKKSSHKAQNSDELLALFLSVSGSDTSIEQWEEYQQLRAGNARSELCELEALWHEMESIQDLPWPSADELTNDQYDGSLTVGRYQKHQTKASYKDYLHRLVRRAGHLILRPVFVKSVAFALLLVMAVPLATITHQWLEEARGIYRTDVAEHRLITLEDGSELLLGGRSEVHVSFSVSTRQLLLKEGEVLFTVAKDPARPFEVNVNGATVRAIGTAFNIRKAAGQATVTVVEGVVEVDDVSSKQIRNESGWGDAEQRLTVGQAVELALSGQWMEAKTVAIDNAISWRYHKLSYVGEPLQAVIADINRYFDTEIAITDSRIASFKFTGTIHKEEIGDWLSALGQVFPVQLQRVSDQSWHLIYAEREINRDF